MESERGLTIAYSIITALGATASITCGIAWGHWKETLDRCPRLGLSYSGWYQNCSCILYGSHTPTQFWGGSQSPCIWVTYGPLVYIIIFIGVATFHGYRVLFSSTRPVTRTVTTKNEMGETVEIHAVQVDPGTGLPRAYWTTMSCVTAFFTLYTLVHFAIYLDGYLKTCRQYRTTLEHILVAGGTLLTVIQERLSCNAIFDFMDYVQTDSGYGYRDGYINTGLDLSLGISAAFFTWVLFLFTAVINVMNARRKV